MNSHFLSSHKYVLNKDTLVYEAIEINLQKRFRNIALIIVACAITSIVFIKLFIGYIDTPKEILLTKQNEILLKKYIVLQADIQNFDTRLNLLNNSDDSIYRSIFGQKPIAPEIRQAGTGGAFKILKSDSTNYEEVIQETSMKIKALDNQLKVSEKSYKELMKLAHIQKERLRHIPAIMPIHNHDLQRTGSGFGRRFHPILQIWRMHEGQDFNAPLGTKVFATGNATVKKVYVSKTFGNCIILDHGYGYETYYAHLQKFNVRQGEKVKRGNVIGYLGSTGLSSGMHLHYEVHKDGVEVNPINYFYNDLSPEQYDKIIAIANEITISMD